MRKVPTRVFLSYSHADSDWANSLAEELGKHGIVVLSSQNLRQGESYGTYLRQAIRKSHYVIPIMGESGSNSTSMLFELGAAIGIEKVIIPIVPKNASYGSLDTVIKSRQTLVKDEPEVTTQQLLAIFSSMGKPASRANA